MSDGLLHQCVDDSGVLRRARGSERHGALSPADPKPEATASGSQNRRRGEAIVTRSLEERFQNLHEFVTQARINLERNNWDYLIGGSETETTLARNRAALDAWGFRPRVLRDVSNVDCSRTFL